MYLRNIKRVSGRSERFHATSLLKHGKVRLEEEILPVTKNGSGSAHRSRSHLTVFKQTGRGGYLRCLQGPSKSADDDLEQPSRSGLLTHPSIFLQERFL